MPGAQASLIKRKHCSESSEGMQHLGCFLTWSGCFSSVHHPQPVFWGMVTGFMIGGRREGTAVGWLRAGNDCKRAGDSLGAGPGRGSAGDWVWGSPHQGGGDAQRLPGGDNVCLGFGRISGVDFWAQEIAEAQAQVRKEGLSGKRGARAWREGRTSQSGCWSWWPGCSPLQGGPTTSLSHKTIEWTPTPLSLLLSKKNMSQ